MDAGPPGEQTASGTQERAAQIRDRVGSSGQRRSVLALSSVSAFDLAVVTAFVLVGLWTTLLLWAKSGPNHHWTGTNGRYLGDVMQYLGWIRSSYGDILIGNPFTASGGTRDFLNPALVVSETLVRFGVSTWLSYLLWTPVAAVALAFCVRALVRRLIPGTASRRIALVLALFYFSPVPYLATHLHSPNFYLGSYALEMWPVGWLWGYPLTALALAFFIGAILTFDRGRDEKRLVVSAPLCALLCAWLFPWMGATLLVLLVGAEIYLRIRRLRHTPTLLLATTTVACAVPLAYFALLGHFDPTWRIAGQVNNSFPEYPRELAFVLLPIVLLAAVAYVRPPRSFLHLAVLSWPLSALAVFFGIYTTGFGTFPKHAIESLGIPLAVLAVLGFDVLRGESQSRVLLVATCVTVVVLLLPTLPYLKQTLSYGRPNIFGAEPYYIQTSESDALQYLARSNVSGSVLSTVYLGQIVPAETGRNTWVGIASWTPNYSERVDVANRLFAGDLATKQSVRLVESTGARFLLSDCYHPDNLSTLLSSIVQARIRFGCASVYIVQTARRR